jgi:hypothetical protein
VISKKMISLPILVLYGLVSAVFSSDWG